MADQVLKDSNGYTLGTITTDRNGKQTIKDKNGYTKGSYDPKSNTTKNPNGYTVGTGNLLTTLL